ncbi:MAG: hypothetical protein WCN87_03740, partial [Chlamydiota bacterium]
MSDDNKVGSSSGSPVNPDDAQYLAEAAAEEQLATPPAQAFSLNKQQDQSSTSDDTNTNSSKDAQKKEDIKKQQQQQAADAAAKQAQAAQKKPSPLDSSFHTNLKDQKTATPTTPAPLQTPKKEQPKPLSLPNTGEKLPSKDPSVLQDILKSPQPDTTSKNLGTPTKMDPKETLAPLTNALKSAGQDDFVKASSLNQQTSADSTANKMQNSQTTSSLSQHTTDVQTVTSDKDTDWKDKQTTVRKDDIEQTHLDRKFTGDKIETQIQTKIETTNEITPSSG